MNEIIPNIYYPNCYFQLETNDSLESLKSNIPSFKVDCTV